MEFVFVLLDANCNVLDSRFKNLLSVLCLMQVNNVTSLKNYTLRVNERTYRLIPMLSQRIGAPLLITKSPPRWFTEVKLTLANILSLELGSLEVVTMTLGSSTPAHLYSSSMCELTPEHNKKGLTLI